MNTALSIPEAIRQVITACAKGHALFTAALNEPVEDGWVLLDPARVTEAYIDLEAALEAVRSIVRQLHDETPPELAKYLDRAENGLEYSLSTISIDASEKVKAYASRAQSAQRQLAGLSGLSEQTLTGLDDAVRAIPIIAKE